MPSTKFEKQTAELAHASVANMSTHWAVVDAAEALRRKYAQREHQRQAEAALHNYHMKAESLLSEVLTLTPTKPESPRSTSKQGSVRSQRGKLFLNWLDKRKAHRQPQEHDPELSALDDPSQAGESSYNWRPERVHSMHTRSVPDTFNARSHHLAEEGWNLEALEAVLLPGQNQPQRRQPPLQMPVPKRKSVLGEEDDVPAMMTDLMRLAVEAHTSKWVNLDLHGRLAGPPPDAAWVVTRFKRMHMLTSLDLSGNGLQGELLQAAIKAVGKLSRFDHLTHLNLTGAQFTDADARSLGEVITDDADLAPIPASLVSLQLADCGISSLGTHHLLEKLFHHRALTDLDVSGCEIDFVDSVQVCTLLEKNNVLQWLRLQDTVFTTSLSATLRLCQMMCSSPLKMTVGKTLSEIKSAQHERKEEEKEHRKASLLHDMHFVEAPWCVSLHNTFYAGEKKGYSVLCEQDLTGGADTLMVSEKKRKEAEGDARAKNPINLPMEDVETAGATAVGGDGSGGTALPSSYGYGEPPDVLGKIAVLYKGQPVPGATNGMSSPKQQAAYLQVLGAHAVIIVSELNGEMLAWSDQPRVGVSLDAREVAQEQKLQVSIPVVMVGAMDGSRLIETMERGGLQVMQFLLNRKPMFLEWLSVGEREGNVQQRWCLRCPGCLHEEPVMAQLSSCPRCNGSTMHKRRAPVPVPAAAVNTITEVGGEACLVPHAHRHRGLDIHTLSTGIFAKADFSQFYAGKPDGASRPSSSGSSDSSCGASAAVGGRADDGRASCPAEISLCEAALMVSMLVRNSTVKTLRMVSAGRWLPVDVMKGEVTVGAASRGGEEAAALFPDLAFAAEEAANGDPLAMEAMALHSAKEEREVLDLRPRSVFDSDLFAGALALLGEGGAEPLELEQLGEEEQGEEEQGAAEECASLTLVDSAVVGVLLVGNKTLTRLDFSGNHLGDSVAIVLAFALRKNETLQWLGLKRCGVSDAGMAEIGHGILACERTRLCSIACDAFDIEHGVTTLDFSLTGTADEAEAAAGAATNIRSMGGGGGGGRGGGSDKFYEGDKVEANYCGRGKYYPGNIDRAHSSGTYDVKFDDDEFERDVEGRDIRSVGGGADNMDFGRVWKAGEFLEELGRQRDADAEIEAAAAHRHGHKHEHEEVRLTASTCVLLAAVLQNNTSLTELNLSGIGIGGEWHGLEGGREGESGGGGAIGGDVLHTHNSMFRSTPGAVDALSQCLCVSSGAYPLLRMSSLVLESCALHEWDVRRLASTMHMSAGVGPAMMGATGSSLQHLVLAHNTLGPAGAEHVAVMLGHSGSNLTSLDLRATRLWSTGAEALSRAFITNPRSRLLHLDLSRNDLLGAAGGRHISTILLHARNLKSLVAEGNNLGNEGAREIFEVCIRGAARRKQGSSGASGNTGEDEGEGQSPSQRPPSSALTHLDLRNNGFMPLVVERLAGIMATGKQEHMHVRELRVLDLSQNRIVDHRNSKTTRGLQTLCKNRRIRLVL